MPNKNIKSKLRDYDRIEVRDFFIACFIFGLAGIISVYIWVILGEPFSSAGAGRAVPTFITAIICPIISLVFLILAIRKIRSIKRKK